jgi:hypothetical protein
MVLKYIFDIKFIHHYCFNSCDSLEAICMFFQSKKMKDYKFEI